MLKPSLRGNRFSGISNSDFFLVSDIWADIYEVYVGHSDFLSAKPIKPTLFKNSEIQQTKIQIDFLAHLS
jgi:hypothetical protein